MAFSIIFARAILSHLQREGVDPALLLERCKLNANRLVDLGATISTAEFELLTQHALALTNDPALGLSVGANEPANTLQVVGHLMLAQQTLRDVIVTLKRYASLLTDNLTCDLLEEGDVARFTCTLAFPQRDSSRTAIEYTLAMAARVGRSFAPHGPLPFDVRFVHAAPSYAARYEATFGCPVLFEQAHNGLSFSRAFLDKPRALADSTVRGVFQQTADRLLQEREQSENGLLLRVRVLLRQTADLANLRCEHIALQLGLSPRALRRRLASENAVFSALLDEARCRRACEELRRSDGTIKATAELLGFSEPSAFHRAFKRWTGGTPAQFLQRPQSPGGLGA